MTQKEKEFALALDPKQFNDEVLLLMANRPNNPVNYNLQVRDVALSWLQAKIQLARFWDDVKSPDYRP